MSVPPPKSISFKKEEEKEIYNSLVHVILSRLVLKQGRLPIPFLAMKPLQVT
jgi:hypothetical protein